MAKSLAKLKEEQEKLKAQIKEAEEREAHRVGRLAASEGLLDLNISDAEWRQLFKETAARFRQKAEKPAGQAAGQSS